jgi:uncharacterized membrane protein YjgN (DUF898 family)
VRDDNPSTTPHERPSRLDGTAPSSSSWPGAASTTSSRETPRAPTLAEQLESGALRPGAGVTSQTALAASRDVGSPRARGLAMHSERLRFHGQGAEYFRIWVVHLFLTLVTLGVYSAWAKVRKARWFAQHTSLGGDRFDYHGEPWRVLVGRLMALVLVLVWSVGFDVSPWLGLIVLAVFCVIGPLLFASAQRFRLANTSWRGLRFGFDVPRRKVYMVCVPLLLLWTAGSVLQSLGIEGAWIGAVGLAVLAVFPWAHARLKQMQHEHANWGDLRFGFDAAGPEFYGLYAKAIALAIVGAMFTLPVFLFVAGARDGSMSSVAKGVVVGIVTVVLMWMMAWPYFAARMQQIVWAHTRLGAVSFRGEMKGAKLWRLVVVQTLLTVITFGLYWPFAAVAIARYRVESIIVETPDPLSRIEADALQQDGPRATGDAAADFFGLDLGW